MKFFEWKVKKWIFLRLQKFLYYKSLVVKKLGGKNFGALSSPKLSSTEICTLKVWDLIAFLVLSIV